MPLPARRAPAHRIACIAAMAVLAGCANPIVKLDTAGNSLVASPAPIGEPASMDQAIVKLNHVRAAYHEAIRDQRGTTQNTITGIVWLGAGMLGAASHVHRDVLVTTGVVGGTTYGLTSAQLDQRRIDVWQAGIDALDCARDAITPLEMRDELRTLLMDRLRELQTQVAAVTVAKATLTAHQGKPYVTAEENQAIAESLAQAEEALKQAGKAQDAGEAQLHASRGSSLSVAVNRISSKVTQVQNTIALPVSAVKDILADLPKQINAIVPGALPASTPAANAASGAKTAAVAGPKAESESPVPRDLRMLADALTKLSQAQSAVIGSLQGVNTSAALSALKACNVADVIKPFELVPATWTFTEGRAENRGFEIRGGVPNYRVRVLGTLPEGLSTSFEGDAANTVGITISAKVAPTEARILVSDRSNPPQTQQFILKVVAAAEKPANNSTAAATTTTTTAANTTKPNATKAQAGSKPATGSTPTAGTTPPTTAEGPAPDAAAIELAWKELQAALKAPNFSRSVRGVTLSVEAADFKPGRLLVKLKCSKPDAGLAAAEVRDELLAAAPKAREVLVKHKALDDKLQQIDLSRSKPCVKE